MEKIKVNSGILIKKLRDHEDDFLILNTESKKVRIEKLEKNGSKYSTPKGSKDEVVFKLVPTALSSKHLDRAKLKGIRDVAPDFKAMQDRADKKASGDSKLFRASVRVPGILIGNSNDNIDDERLYVLGKAKDDDVTLKEILTLPRISKLEMSGNTTSLFNVFDHRPNALLGYHRNLLSLLVDKGGDYSIGKADLELVWEIGFTVMMLSLASYDVKIKNIMLPESTGYLTKKLEEIASKFLTGYKVSIIKKPKVEDLYRYYTQRKSNYSKLTNSVRVGFRDYDNKFSGETKQEIGDIFKDADGKFYDFLEDGKIKIFKVKRQFHRHAISKIMSDMHLFNSKGTLTGDTLLFDDNVVSGSTMRDLLIPIAKGTVKDGQILPFCFFGQHARDTRISGITKENLNDDNS